MTSETTIKHSPYNGYSALAVQGHLLLIHTQRLEFYRVRTVRNLQYVYTESGGTV
jgi:hypothetical protein